MAIAYYKGEKCLKTGNSEAEAIACEQTHLRAAAIRILEYINSPYPSHIMLVFPDGKEVEYVKYK